MIKEALPEGWENYKLKDAVNILDNLRKPINSTERQQRVAGKSKKELYPYYGATGQVGWIDDYLTDGDYILIGEDGAPFLDLVKPKAYKIAGKTWVNNHAHILQAKSNISINKYVLYYLNSIRYGEFVNGTTRLKLTKGSLETIPFILPPLPEQQLIVEKIEELFSELDKSIENLKTAQQQLKVYRQAVLKWAFEGKLTNEEVKDGELPEGWEWVKVLHIGKVETGSTPSKQNPDFYTNSYPFYKPTDLEAGFNVRQASDNLSELGIKQARFLPVNSILVTCIGATIGKTGIIRKAGASNQQINSIIPFTQFNSDFMYYQVVGPKFQKSIKDNASATTLPILNKSKFQNLEMVVCSEDEQKQIVQEIESRLSVCDKMEETIITSIQQAEALRQSILKKAFEGKLVKN